MKSVTLAPGLSLPVPQVACEVTALIGNRGGGKSNGAVVLVEGLLEAGVQVVVIDYVGIWFGLRLGPDGKTPSRFGVPILGGRHGDVDLSPAAGRVVAEALAVRGSSAILDVSLFAKSDRARFATDFAEALFQSKKAHPGPCLVVLEEAQRFVPQKFWKGQERMLGAWEEVGEVGRNFGLGLLLISQRPQKIAKDVLNLADNLLAFRTNGKLERDALSDWVQEKGAEGQRDIADALPGLPTGTCYAWSPSRNIFGRYAVRLKSTYDAGATPVGARASVATKPLDLKALEKAMGEAASEAQRDTPSALRTECQSLRAKVAVLEKAAGTKASLNLAPVRSLERRVRSVRDELDLFAKILRERIPTEIGQIRKSFEEAIGAFEKDLTRTTSYRLEKVLAVLRASGFGEDEAGAGPVAPSRSPSTPRDFVTTVPVGERLKARPVPDEHSHGLSPGEDKILRAAAQHERQGGVTRAELSVLVGYKRSSRDTFVQRLKTKGYLEDEGGMLRATPDGMAQINNFVPLPEGDALLRYWYERLPEGERRVLEVAVRGYPAPVERSLIDEHTGYKRSSRDTVIQRLRARRLLDDAGGGAVAASSLLFDGGIR